MISYCYDLTLYGYYNDKYVIVFIKNKIFFLIHYICSCVPINYLYLHMNIDIIVHIPLCITCIDYSQVIYQVPRVK